MLPVQSRRAYHEARHRRRHGERTPGSRIDEEAVQVWMNAFEIADTDDVSPWDALLLAVRRRAARVRSIDKILEAAWVQHRSEATEKGWNPEVPGAEVRIWLAESRNEEKLLVRSAKMAIDAGVSEALVRRRELQGSQFIDDFVAVLDELHLNDDQRLRAMTTFHSRLTAALPEGKSGKTIIDVDILDRDDDDGQHGD